VATFDSADSEAEDGSDQVVFLGTPASLPSGGLKEEEGALTGCREAVEILTRNPKKSELLFSMWSF
jgi:hypothetical protein